MHDILISGGGVAGLSLAIALRRAFGETFQVAVLDARFGQRDANVRTSALTAASCNLLSAIGVWPEVRDAAQPIAAMRVTDSRRKDSVRPVFLSFDEPLRDGSPFAWMAQNRDLVAALERQAENAGVDILRDSLARLAPQGAAASVHTAGGLRLNARLVVGADGAQSRVRRLCGVETVSRDYGRTAIIATLAHEEDHGGVAVQHFLPPGPFAMLPLTGRRSSIVWVEASDQAKRYMALEEPEFLFEIERRFGSSLGLFSLESGPASFPLRAHLARTFTAPRVALVGDAAHLIHPLAGQGLNLGLRDVAALTEAVAAQVRLGLDPGADSALAAYGRARYADSFAMVAGTDSLHRLFSNDLGPLRFVRDIGLGLVDRMPRLKRALIREAAGVAGRTPALLQGRLP